MRARAMWVVWLVVALMGPLVLVGLAQLETSAAMNELLAKRPRPLVWALALCDAGPCLRAPASGLVAWLRPETPFLLFGAGAGVVAGLVLVWRRLRLLALLPIGALGMGLLTFAGIPSEAELRARPVMDGARRIAAHFEVADEPLTRPAVVGLVRVRSEVNVPRERPRDPVLGWDSERRVVADRSALRWALAVHWLLCAAGLVWLERRGTGKRDLRDRSRGARRSLPWGQRGRRRAGGA